MHLSLNYIHSYIFLAPQTKMAFRVSLDKQRGLNFSQKNKQRPLKLDNSQGVENYCVAYTSKGAWRSQRPLGRQSGSHLKNINLVLNVVYS